MSLIAVDEMRQRVEDYDRGMQWFQQVGQQYQQNDQNDQPKGTKMQWSDSGGGDFEQPPVGTHVARCVKMIDIGTQRGEYQGKPTARRQVIIGWELPNELMTEGEYAGKPFAVSKFYTQSLGEKANLRKDLTNWRGRQFTEAELSGFDAKNILGVTCMLSLTENEKQRVRVTGVMALPRGTPVPPQINPTVYLSLDPDEFKESVFLNLSEKMQAMIKLSPEYAALYEKPMAATARAPAQLPPSHAFADMDEDIPF